jgi:gluconolactonase
MADQKYFVARAFTEPGGFTEGIEGPACDPAGNLYAVNYQQRGTIGKVTAAGDCELFVTLPPGSVGNGLRFDRSGTTMFVADYTGHAVLQITMATRAISVYAHEPTLHQPNDLAIAGDGTLYASDPDWASGSGRIWRVGADRRFVCLASQLGTTNGIEVGADERMLFVNETVQRQIWVYDLAPAGAISNKRLLITFPDHALDGMRCDVAGNLYVTRYGKGSIAVVSPKGELLREVGLNGKDCTNLTFGGPDGCTCYVTVADTGNIEAFRTELPGYSWQCWAKNAGNPFC